ncbi:MAG TPA: RNA-binding protein S1, partial [Candidatus Enterococcus stercoravium]|nr:RNA-binding protein S1 [Candidatus Enterococcus stercoravium]
RGGKKPFNRGGQGRGSFGNDKKEDFDSLMSSFLKDSDDRLSSLRRNTEGKRGGRGGRRN